MWSGGACRKRLEHHRQHDCGCGSYRRGGSGRHGGLVICLCGLWVNVSGGGLCGHRDGRVLHGLCLCLAPSPSPSPSLSPCPCLADDHRACWGPSSGRHSGLVTCPSPYLCRGVGETSSGRGGAESSDRGRTLMNQRGASPWRLEARYWLFFCSVLVVITTSSVRAAVDAPCASAGGRIGCGCVVGVRRRRRSCS